MRSCTSRRRCPDGLSLGRDAAHRTRRAGRFVAVCPRWAPLWVTAQLSCADCEKEEASAQIGRLGPSSTPARPFGRAASSVHASEHRYRRRARPRVSRRLVAGTDLADLETKLDTMLLSAVVTRDELAQLVESITPLRVFIDERRGRSMTVARPHAIELVPKRGLRIPRRRADVVGRRRSRHPHYASVLAGPRRAADRHARRLAGPRVRARARGRRPEGRSRVLRRQDRRGDREGSRAAGQQACVERRTRPLPTLGPLDEGRSRRAFALTVADASVEVTAEQLRLTVRLDARFEQLASTEERPPAEATRPPAEATRPPAEGTRPSAEEARPPAEATRPPAEGTSPPAEETRPPEGTRPPLERLRGAVERLRAAQAARAVRGTLPPAQGTLPPVERLRAGTERLRAAQAARSRRVPAKSHTPHGAASRPRTR